MPASLDRNSPSAPRSNMSSAQSMHCWPQFRLSDFSARIRDVVITAMDFIPGSFTTRLDDQPLALDGRLSIQLLQPQAQVVLVLAREIALDELSLKARGALLLHVGGFGGGEAAVRVGRDEALAEVHQQFVD